MFQIIAANRAADGTRVFLAANGQWVEAVAEAVLLQDIEIAAALERARRDADQLVVVEPYLTALRRQGGQFEPTRLRGLSPPLVLAAE
jgi:hypothetical protein